MRPSRPANVEAAPAPREDPLALGRADALRLAAIALTACAAMLAVATDWQSPLRAALVLVFLLVVPGLALGELVEIDDPIRRLALAIGASLAIDTLVAVTLFYLELYSVETAMAIVTAITIAAVLATVLRRSRRPRTPRRLPDSAPRRAVS